MSYYGSKFPDEIDPLIYREILNLKEISCPIFRRSASKAANSRLSIEITCQGCQTPDALKMVTFEDGSERFFVRTDSNCTK